jgi:hypothetical protein
MFSQEINKSRIETQQQIFNNINGYFIKIDYFDHKGTKNFENNIPLKSLFNKNANPPRNN